jgi:hypothetical protein
MSLDEVGTVVLPVDQSDPQGVWKALIKITFSDAVAYLGEADQNGKRIADIRKSGSEVSILRGIVRDEKQLRRLVQRARSLI